MRPSYFQQTTDLCVFIDSIPLEIYIYNLLSYLLSEQAWNNNVTNVKNAQRQYHSMV
jgi:hypothetical protein